jgi:hypothetical protein
MFLVTAVVITYHALAGILGVQAITSRETACIAKKKEKRAK